MELSIDGDFCVFSREFDGSKMAGCDLAKGIMQNRHCRFTKDTNIQFLPQFDWQDAPAVVQVAMHKALLVCPRVTIDFPASSYAFGHSHDSGKNARRSFAGRYRLGGEGLQHSR
jgi:hypothetical protein